MLLARTEARATELADRYPGALTFAADLASPESLAVPELDRLDSVLHVAGVVDLATVADQPVAQLREQIEVNLVAPAVLTRLTLAAVRRAARHLRLRQLLGRAGRQPRLVGVRRLEVRAARRSPTRCAARRSSTASG